MAAQPIEESRNSCVNSNLECNKIQILNHYNLHIFASISKCVSLLLMRASGQVIPKIAWQTAFLFFHQQTIWSFVTFTRITKIWRATERHWGLRDSFSHHAHQRRLLREYVFWFVQHVQVHLLARNSPQTHNNLRKYSMGTRNLINKWNYCNVNNPKDDDGDGVFFGSYRTFLSFIHMAFFSCLSKLKPKAGMGNWISAGIVVHMNGDAHAFVARTDESTISTNGIN